MKFAIIGRTATGKSVLAQALADNGLTLLSTYTTRPPRINDMSEAASHKFITQSEADAFDPSKKLLRTELAGNEYFTTAEDLAAADVIVVEPEGLYALAEALPGQSIRVIHCKCADEDAQKLARQHALKRGADPADEAVKFAARLQAEDERYTKFEDALTHNDTFGFSSLLTFTYNNQFNPECLHDMVATILAHKRKCENLKVIAQQCVDLGVLTSSKPGCVDVVYEHPTPYTMAIELDLYVDTLFYSDQNLAAMIHAWLSHNITITTPEELVIEQMNKDAKGVHMFTDDEEAALLADAEPETEEEGTK